jgi:hypothetical protein
LVPVHCVARIAPAIKTRDYSVPSYKHKFFVRLCLAVKQ